MKMKKELKIEFDKKAERILQVFILKINTLMNEYKNIRVEYTAENYKNENAQCITRSLLSNYK